MIERAQAARATRTYPALLSKLSESSVEKHFDAYADVAWDHPAHQIDPTDPRWEKSADDVLGATEWYRAQPQAVRARLGLHHIVTQMKTGIEFEAVLSHGLLNFTTTLPNGAPEFRYAYHELIEEGQHSLMFQEFVNRSGLEVHGLRGLDALGARIVPRFGRTFPELFFLFVLGGEAPIDHVQRRELRRGVTHPLLRRVMQIHVTEEARHLCFARSYLLENVPKLGAFRRFQLKVRTPFILAAMTQQMLRPSAHLVKEYDIPDSVVREAYTQNPVHRERTLDSIASVRELCHKMGLITPRFLKLWQALGIAPRSDDAPGAGGTGDDRRRGHDETRPNVLELRVPGIVRAAGRDWIRPMAECA